MNPEPVHEVLARSATVSLSATVIASLIGIALGTLLALAKLPGRRLLTAVVNTGMAVPTVVVGLVVALLLWRSGPLGDLGLIYTVRGMIIAQVAIATPLITGITMAALQLLPPELPEQLRSLGANRLQLVARLWIEARLPLLAAAMAGFGHAISEVGSATLVGGNIHGQTQVMTTAIVENVSRGEFGVAVVYGAILLVLAFVVNGLLVSIQQRGASWARS
ncbi:binding-protein-dependent transport systems inner membrane component [Kribbella flavida DSM 17836]|uniref:Binding-protein-dependent transport systems inner membrane component n=1 Tax=Kribbella flavida (strain DSM 17836 / JCM 10339 / NBRC 14399) TaxID=479435 RepID=D2PS80_KRIFD|nr:ABC transporter permease [Kribbella flavida]ADB31204.1 binding-protein-dependent transport systems inner membrane component [Kribbella flavida DSM 17836]